MQRMTELRNMNINRLTDEKAVSALPVVVYLYNVGMKTEHPLKTKVQHGFFVHSYPTELEIIIFTHWKRSSESGLAQYMHLFIFWRTQKNFVLLIWRKGYSEKTKTAKPVKMFMQSNYIRMSL